MNLQKIQDDVINAFKKNKDLLNAFKDLRAVGKERENLSESKKIFEIVNALCKKSKRVILEDCYITSNNYYSKNQKIGINQSGLGTMSGYSSQLSVFNSTYRYSDGDYELIKNILKDGLIFSKLIVAVNKNSVKDLKALRNYYLKKKDLVAVGKENIIIEDLLKIEFDKKMAINYISFTDGEGDTLEDYSSRKLREVERMLDRDDTEIFVKENVIEMKKYADNILEMEFKTLKVFLFLFDNKRAIISEIKKKIKETEKKTKSLKKEDVFLTTILNPLKAFDNL